MKDNFSNHASDYVRYRPTYPSSLYRYLFSLVTEKNNAWDCGTGNGQVAIELAKGFNHVWATDLSENQIMHAPKRANIHYEVRTSEAPVEAAQLYDMITVGQAIHWFDFDAFYKNVKQILKPHGVLAAIGYSVLQTEGKLNTVIEKFYKEITHPYWDAERKYLDDHYATIPFPFKEEVSPLLSMDVNWTRHHLLHYLNTWSAVKHFETANGENPIQLIKDEVDDFWGSSEKRRFEFPLFLRVGRI